MKDTEVSSVLTQTKNKLTESATAKNLKDACAALKSEVERLEAANEKLEALETADMPTADRDIQKSRLEWEIGKIELAVAAAEANVEPILSEFRALLAAEMDQERNALFKEFVSTTSEWFDSPAREKWDLDALYERTFKETRQSVELSNLRYAAMTVVNPLGHGLKVQIGAERCIQCAERFDEAGTFLPAL